MTAAILCGGRGTRLGSATADQPKPLAVAEAPFLDTLVFALAPHGVRNIVLLARFKAERIDPPQGTLRVGARGFVRTLLRRAPAARCGGRASGSMTGSSC